jgi:hypothetical protein
MRFFVFTVENSPIIEDFSFQCNIEPVLPKRPTNEREDLGKGRGSI